MEGIKNLSIVVPAYKQQKTIKRDIKVLKKVLKRIGIPYEIIVVVDGRLDKTYERASRMRSKTVRVLGYRENKGKGYAVQYGASKTRGDVIGFIDSGMDIDPNGISMLLHHMVWYDADIIVGSKLHPVSQVHYPLQRRILSWGYRRIIRLFFGLTVRDTQAGLKLFKRKVVNDVFPRLLVKTFAFDIEVLSVAHRLGYSRIFDAPIKLNFDPLNTSLTSRKVLKQVYYMFRDTVAVFYRLKIIRYYDKKLKYYKKL